MLANARAIRDASWITGSGEGRSNPSHYSCLGNLTDKEAWWATVHRVAKIWSWLKWLSMHTHSWFTVLLVWGIQQSDSVTYIYTHIYIDTHIHIHIYIYICFPGASVIKSLPANAGDKRCRFDPWVGKIPWRRARQSTPVFMLGEFHGKRSLEGYSP